MDNTSHVPSVPAQTKLCLQCGEQIPAVVLQGQAMHACLRRECPACGLLIPKNLGHTCLPKDLDPTSPVPVDVEFSSPSSQPMPDPPVEPRPGEPASVWEGERPLRNADFSLGEGRARKALTGAAGKVKGYPLLRQAMKENQEKAGELGLAYMKTGNILDAVKMVWPQLPITKQRWKAAAIARSAWFPHVVKAAQEEYGTRANVSQVWCLNMWRDIALHSKNAGIRLRASELIGKHLGMFIERKEVRNLTVDLSGMPKEKLAELIKARMEMLKLGV